MREKALSALALLAVFLLIAGCSAQAPPTAPPAPQANTEPQQAAQQQAQQPQVTTPQENKSAAPPAPLEPENQEVIIRATFGGFEPRNVFISPGTTVKFVNEDRRGHWPASTPHPAHTDYPGFDAGHSLALGESYSFTFEKKGQWHYHDHTNLAFGGTIEVE